MLTNYRVLVGSLGMWVCTGCAVDPVDTPEATTEVHAVTQAPGHVDSPDDTGMLSTSGAIDPNNPFFLSLGTNQRACGTCHTSREAWSITPKLVVDRFNKSGGMDPLFRTNDGSVSPNADVSTLDKRRVAYNMLLTRAVIRIGLPIPANAEFTLAAVDDPYGFASAAELSLFRRPLPTTNLRFLSARMWDTREPDLTQQAIDATLGHAQATGVDTQAMTDIVSFETGIYTAQIQDKAAGDLTKNTDAGPEPLVTLPFFIGINDPFGGNPRGDAFDPVAFTLFDAFAPPANPKKGPPDLRRYAIYRGQQIFNTRPITITGVAGLNDLPGLSTIAGTCTTCHDVPNVGNHSVPLAIDIGLTDASRRTPDMPLYTLENATTHQQIQTTDPGRALITGKWADLNKFKAPILRGVSARPPYFHNGLAKDLDAVVDFYNTRFGLGLSSTEHQDLVAFLQAL
jgi:cytochrome c peroxidase